MFLPHSEYSGHKYILWSANHNDVWFSSDSLEEIKKVYREDGYRLNLSGYKKTPNGWEPIL